MKYSEIEQLELGDTIKVRNPHKNKKTDNDKAIWRVVSIATKQWFVGRPPKCYIEAILVEGTYVEYEKKPLGPKEPGYFRTFELRAIEKV